MNVATAFTIIREQTGTDSINMPDTPLMRYFNLVYHDIEAKIVSYINEHVFYKKLATDTVANQEKYPFPSWWSTTDTNELRKLLTVWIKYNTTDTVYTKCEEVNQSWWDLDIDTYKTWQDTSNPVFLIQDRSVYIYPAPTEAITNWLKIEAVKKLIDLTTASTEADIKIPRDYHRILITWTKYWVYDYRWLTNKKQEAWNDYKIALREMIWEMTDFTVMPIERANPDLSDLMR